MSSNSNNIRSNSKRPLKVALVHDYLNDFGGAERVLEALCEIFPDAPIYTAFYRKGSAYDRFKDRKIITSWAQRVPFFSSKLVSPLRFLAPLIWNSFNSQLADYDVVISSSSWYVTKGFGRRDPSTPLRLAALAQDRSGLQRPVEVCYCHTPPRYLYGYATSVNWQKHWYIRLYALIVNHFMRVYDFEDAQRVDYFIANSKEVQGRIKKFYRRDSVVIYPPVNVDRLSGMVHKEYGVHLRGVPGRNYDHLGGVTGSAATRNRDDYFLVVSRLVASKNVDLAVKVCKNLKLPLKVVGTGRELENLKKLANYSSSERSESRSSLQESSSRQARTIINKSRIQFLGDVDDDQLINLYQNCRAVIFPASQEDFGLVPVEAMAAGKPVIALSEGGVLETVIDGKTGVFFNEAKTGSLGMAINKFMELEKKGAFDAKFIKNHAEKWSRVRFKKEILKFVENCIKK